QLREAFEQEAFTWCRLWWHPHIITAQCLTRLPGWNDLPVLVLQYAPNSTMRQALQQAHQPGKHLSLDAAFTWSQQIASALAHMHMPDPTHERPHPLVHADLKPENVLLDARNHALLTDLGLSRVWARTTEAEAESPIPLLPPSAESAERVRQLA